MSSLELDQCDTKESCVQQTLDAYNSKEYSSILKVAHAFAIPYSITKNRVSGRILQIKAWESVQNLSNAEEKTLIQWITRFAVIGFPVFPRLVFKNCWKNLAITFISRTSSFVWIFKNVLLRSTSHEGCGYKLLCTSTNHSYTGHVMSGTGESHFYSSTE